MRRPSITKPQADKIWNLWQQGIPIRKISRDLDLCRRSVQRFINERCFPEGKKSKNKVANKPPTKKEKHVLPPDRSAEVVWCKACSAYVYPPCLACQIRSIKERNNREKF